MSIHHVSFGHVNMHQWNFCERKNFCGTSAKGIGSYSDSFLFDYEPNGISFVHNQKENGHYDYIPSVV